VGRNLSHELVPFEIVAESAALVVLVVLVAPVALVVAGSDAA
jgi:hypothetical protein